MSLNIMSYDKGLHVLVPRIIECWEKRKGNFGVRKSVFVAVYGWPGSGKSRLISELTDYFVNEKMNAVGAGAGPTPDQFDRMRAFPQYAVDIRFFHCAWHRSESFIESLGWSLFSHEDPNALSKKILGRDVDLNVFIYDPKKTRDVKESPEHYEGRYDILIENPH
jgi:hypothetical protein